MSRRTGADLAVESLTSIGATTVFGVPGSQNVALFEALRRSSLRTVVPTDEMAAAFMAVGYARVTNGLGVVTTIPGPGFTYALTGLAEAQADSAALLYLALSVDHGGKAFALQRLDQAAIAASLVKRVLVVERLDRLPGAIAEGAALALGGEPGPVMVEVPTSLLYASADGLSPPVRQSTSSTGDPSASRALLERTRGSRWPVVIVGQGAKEIGPDLAKSISAAGIPVIPTASGRGIIPEPDPLVFVRDFSYGPGAAVPALLEAADLVIALGSKLSHNGTAGFTLPIRPDRLIHLDPSPEVLGAAYPASLGIVGRCGDSRAWLDDLVTGYRSGWPADQLEGWQRALERERTEAIPWEPSVGENGVLGALFAEIDRRLPANRIVTTDSGLHQAIARNYLSVRRPAGLLAPTDFQSMGFGIPAAIAAKVADPSATVMAVVGDGGFLMTGAELLTARRLDLDLIVVVMNNGSLGLIERQQKTRFGHTIGVDLLNPDFALFAASLGVHYHRGDQDIAAVLEGAMGRGGVHLVEIPLGRQAGLALTTAKARIRQATHRMAGDALWRRLRRMLGRR